MSLKYTSILTICLLGLSACGNDSTRLQSEVDSLRIQNEKQQKELEENTTFVELVNTTLDSILTTEANLLGNVTSKEQIKIKLANYQQTLNSYRNKIEDLKQRLAVSQNANALQIKKAIEKLQEQLRGKEEELSELKELVENKNYDLSQLQAKIQGLQSNLTELTGTSQRQQEALKKKEDKLNEAYFLMAPKKELQEKGILSKKSLFSKSKIDLAESELSNFNKIDVRTRQAFHIPSKSPKILTPVPPGSYVLDVNGKSCTLTIIDVSKFWSISKYLVIQY